MTLRLREGVRAAPTPDGLFLLGPGLSVRLRGASIAAWFDRLVPYLSGDRTRAELTAAVPAGRRPQLDTIIDMLLAQGVVVENPPGDQPPAGLPPVLVVADEPLRSALVDAVRMAGGPVTGIGPGDPLDPDDRTTRVVMHCPRVVTSTEPVDRWSWPRRALVARLVLDSGRAWLHLAGTAETSGAWRRRADLGVVDGDPARCDPLTATVLAGQLTRAAAHWWSRPAATRTPVTTSTDLENLRTTRHRVLPHPDDRPGRAPSATALIDEISALAAMPAVRPDDFSRRVALAADPMFGILTPPDEGRYAQTPLHVAECRVADPGGLSRSAADRFVIGSGLTFDQARLRTGLRAVARYAALMLDRRRLIDADRLWGLDLTTGDARPVRAVTVFPGLDPRAVRRGPGPVAAYSWTDALMDGLIALAGTRFGPARPRYVRPDDGQLTEDGRRCLRILRSVGEPVTCARLVDETGIAAVAVRLGDRAPQEGWARSGEEALSAALERTLLAYQSAVTGEPRYAPSSADPPLPYAGPGPGPGLHDLLAAFLRRGLRPIAVPMNHDPAAADVHPFVASVVLDD